MSKGNREFRSRSKVGREEEKARRKKRHRGDLEDLWKDHEKAVRAMGKRGRQAVAITAGRITQNIGIFRNGKESVPVLGDVTEQARRRAKSDLDRILHAGKDPTSPQVSDLGVTEEAEPMELSERLLPASDYLWSTGGKKTKNQCVQEVSAEPDVERIARHLLRTLPVVRCAGRKILPMRTECLFRAMVRSNPEILGEEVQRPPSPASPELDWPEQLLVSPEAESPWVAPSPESPLDWSALFPRSPTPTSSPFPSPHSNTLFSNSSPQSQAGDFCNSSLFQFNYLV